MEDSSRIDDEINGEYALADALDLIFGHLKVKDLSNASLVCKSWQEAVSRKLSKRGPERLLIPLSSGAICDLMGKKPYAALLFLTKRCFGIKEKILDVVKRYKSSCPGYLVGIAVPRVMMDEVDLTVTGPSDPSEKILSLFLPEYKDLEIRVGHNWNFDPDWDNDKLFDDFLPKVTPAKATIILFTQDYVDCNPAITKRIKRRFRRKNAKYTLWGGSFTHGLLTSENSQIDEDSEEEFSRYMTDMGTLCQPNGVFALSISGPNLDSWSTVVSCFLKKNEFEEKLLDFRASLRLRRRTMGFACGPANIKRGTLTDRDLLDYNGNYVEMMRAVKSVFPDIPFTGIFDPSWLTIAYGIDSTVDDTEQPHEHKLALSMMIITYD